MTRDEAARVLRRLREKLEDNLRRSIYASERSIAEWDAELAALDIALAALTALTEPERTP